MGELVAAGAHGRGAPKIEHDSFRPFAMILSVSDQNLFGRATAGLPRVAGWGGARVDGVEIAAGRQHVEPAARGRAGRARSHEKSVQRAQKAKPFRSA